MKYLHSMVRVRDLDASLRFYCEGLGLRETRRMDSEQGRFTLVYLAAPGDADAQVELTYNWDPEDYGSARNFGHLAYAVDDIYAACQRLQHSTLGLLGVQTQVLDRKLDLYGRCRRVATAATGTNG